MNIITKSSNLAPHLRATSRVVSASLKPTTAAVNLPSEEVVEKPANVLASYKSGPIGSISALSGIGGGYQILFESQLNVHEKKNWNYVIARCEETILSSLVDLTVHYVTHAQTFVLHRMCLYHCFDSGNCVSPFQWQLKFDVHTPICHHPISPNIWKTATRTGELTRTRVVTITW